MKPFYLRTSLSIICFVSIFNALLHFGNSNQIRGDPKLDFDSPFYIELLLWLKGEWAELPPQPFRMRLLIPFIAGLVSDYVGVNNSFGIINSILWIITSIVYFLAIKNIYDFNTGFFSSIIFSFSVPVMVYGAAISTDMLGYLAIASSILYLSVSNQVVRLKYLFLMGIMMFLSMMGREVSVLAVGYIFLHRLLEKRKFKSAVKEAIILLAFSIGGVLTATLLIPQPGYTAYFYKAFLESFNTDKIFKEIYQVLATYHIGWILILYSLFRSLRFKNGKDHLLLTSLIIGVVFLTFDHFVGIISSRFVFLTYPGFLVAVYKGVKEFSAMITLRAKYRDPTTINLTLIALYVIIGFLGTAKNNISLPTYSDVYIAKLFPEDYPVEYLWRI